MSPVEMGEKKKPAAMNLSGIQEKGLVCARACAHVYVHCVALNMCQCLKLSLGHTENPQYNLLLKGKQKDREMTQYSEERRETG